VNKFSRKTLHRLRALSNRLTRSAELQKQQKNFPMAKACLAKKKKVDTVIAEYERMIPEVVLFT
jgi:hypothetical protein